MCIQVRVTGAVEGSRGESRLLPGKPNKRIVPKTQEPGAQDQASIRTSWRGRLNSHHACQGYSIGQAIVSLAKSTLFFCAMREDYSSPNSTPGALLPLFERKKASSGQGGSS
jgi:hypothetical protein